MLLSLADRTYLVTGGGSGIGKGVATAIVGSGGNAVLAGRNEDTFALVDGAWRWRRRYIHVDLHGDLSHHLKASATPFAASALDERLPAFSPDCRFLAYTSSRSGRRGSGRRGRGRSAGRPPGRAAGS